MLLGKTPVTSYPNLSIHVHVVLSKEIETLMSKNCYCDYACTCKLVIA